MANEERRGPRRLAPKLPPVPSSTSSSYTPENRSQSQSQDLQNLGPPKPKRAQVRAACVACQRGKAKVSPTHTHMPELANVSHSRRHVTNGRRIVRWRAALL